MKQRVNAATSAHIPAIVKIAQESFPDPWSENLFQETLENKNTEIYVLETEENSVAGYVVITFCGEEINLDDIAVSLQERGKGLGTALLEFVHSRYPHQNFLLEVRESNQIAQKLYLSMGYEQVGFRKRYYENPREGAILLTRKGESEC